MKSIQTEYAGFHFRSRLEARWAVLFDRLGIEYRYEEQGYELEWRLEWSTNEHGGETFRYLPDFWLPGLKSFFEVKGEFRGSDEWKWMNAAADLAENHAATVIIGGDIFRQPRQGATLPYAVHMHKGHLLAAATDLKPPMKTGTGTEIAYDSDNRQQRGFQTRLDLVRGATVRGDYRDFREACAFAQRARFEYGETPKDVTPWS
jgi:hypothetical protein